MSKAIVVSGHHSGGRFTLLGIPGVYENGVPYPLEKTGRTEKEMRALFDATQLTVEFVDAEEGAEPITPEEASEAASTLARSDEVASEAGRTLAEYESQKRTRKKPAKSAEKEG